jgi:hypothetical protein
VARRRGVGVLTCPYSEGSSAFSGGGSWDYIDLGFFSLFDDHITGIFLLA